MQEKPMCIERATLHEKPTPGERGGCLPAIPYLYLYLEAI